VDRFIDSDSEHFLYFPEDKTNIDQRTENLSPDLVLFLVLAGVAAATFVIRGQLIGFLFTTFQSGASFLLGTDLTSITKGG